MQSKCYVGKNDVGGILVMRCCKLQSFAAQLKMIKSILFLLRSNELLEEVYIIFSLQFRLLITKHICKIAFVYILMLPCGLFITLHYNLRTKFAFFIVSCCYWDIILSFFYVFRMSFHQNSNIRLTFLCFVLRNRRNRKILSNSL